MRDTVKLSHLLYLCAHESHALSTCSISPVSARSRGQVVVFCTRLRRMPVRARLESCQDDYATCTFTTPNWGRQEYVTLELQVNKVEAGIAGFLFYAQPRITYARPHFVVASEVSTVTLKGTDLPSPNGLTLRTGPSTSETVHLGETATIRMRSCATHEVLQTLEPVLGQGTLSVQVGRVAMTGSAYFEISLNLVDYDDAFRRWNDEWLPLTNGMRGGSGGGGGYHDDGACVWACE